MRKKIAHWICHTHLFRNDEHECSNCGYHTDNSYATCPNCGASMRGSQYDSSWVDEMEAIDAFIDD